MWRTYEKVAAYLFNPHREHFGLERVEGKQLLVGETGSPWEIDAKGVLIAGEHRLSSLRASVIRAKNIRSRSLHLWLTQSKILGRQEHVPHAARHNPFVYFHSLDVQDGRQSADWIVGRLRRMREERRSAQRQNIGRRPRIDSDEAKLRVHHTQPLQRRSRCPMPDAGQPVDACGRERLPPRVGAGIVHSPAFQADGLLMITV